MCCASGLSRLLVLLILGIAFAVQGAEPIPALTARVTDRTGTLTPAQAATLEQTLQAFEERKGSQIAVLMVPTTGEEPIEQFALRAAEQWKLGRKGVDDGALLVVAKNDRNLRIEVGYGLEGALTDAASKRIISEIIVPRFQQGDFYGGISAGLDRMMRVAEGEPLPPAHQAVSRPGGTGGGIGQAFPILFLAAVVMGGILRMMLGRFLGAAATGGMVGLLAWWLAGTLVVALVTALVAFFFTLLSGLGGRIGWGGPSWGGRSGWGGGFGDGGFRGGGGGFGGGGASGRW